MTNEQIKKIALACGFKLKEQPTGEMDLNPYVYEFARELIKQHQQSPHNEINENDLVNSPQHYTSHPSGVEAIEITRHMSFNLGNVMKYIWRNGLKDGQPAVQDLQKARWYLDDEIKRLGGK